MTMLEVQRDDTTAIVRLNRPDRRNALSFEGMRQLVSTSKTLGRDRRLRAVVLCGAGEDFCAGLDVAELGKPRNRRVAAWELLKPGPSLFQKAALCWRALPVPVIAAVQGHCIGGGLQLALGADMRIATPASRWAILETRWGLVADMGLSVTARGLVAPDVLMELAGAGRMIDGEEALRCGLVTRLEEAPLESALAQAQAFAERSPDAVLAAKRVTKAMQSNVAGALRLEKRWQWRLLRGRNSAIARGRAKDQALPWQPREFD